MSGLWINRLKLCEPLCGGVSRRRVGGVGGEMAWCWCGGLSGGCTVSVELY